MPTTCLSRCCPISLPYRQPCWPRAAAVGTMRGLWALVLAGLVSACEGKELPPAEGKGHWERGLRVRMGATPSLGRGGEG